jgi:predicted DNA binding CopG/RHH family protein
MAKYGDLIRKARASTGGTEEIETRKMESSLEDVSNQDSSITDSNKHQTSILDSSKTDSFMIDSSKQDSLMLDSVKQEASITDSSKLDSSKVDSIKQDASMIDSGKHDAYAKVAMRLSAEAVQRLKRWRLQTGLPYEILVDVLIRGQDTPTPAQVEEARKIRHSRLLEGKRKALDNSQRKLDQ